MTTLDVIDARADWIAACDTLEFAQDQGYSDAYLAHLEANASAAYDTYQRALARHDR